MALKRFSDSADHGNQIDAAQDGFPTFQNTDDRKYFFGDFFAALGIDTATVGTLPSASGQTGVVYFVSDGRKDGEGAGNGTGVLAQSNGTNWITFDTGISVQA